ncbi:MAG: hypothetical protein ACRDTH_02135 [Pseudonocardiaceae bacterium]
MSAILAVAALLATVLAGIGFLARTTYTDRARDPAYRQLVHERRELRRPYDHHPRWVARGPTHHSSAPCQEFQSGGVRDDQIQQTTKGNSMAVMEYWTKDGLVDFGFSIEFQSGLGWRVYIIFDPFRRGHDHSLDLPYQSIDDDGRRYVDWSSRLDSLADARTVAGIWAELAYRDHRSKKEHAQYVELIQRHQRNQKQKTVTPVHSDRLENAVASGGSAGPQDDASVVSHTRAPAKSSSGPQQRHWSVALPCPG